MGTVISPPDREGARRSPPDREAMRALQEALQQALGGRYILQTVLGVGGYGVVYLARERALDRRVALKVLPPGFATERHRARFLREARVVAHLKHDHIVPIHAVDEAGPFVYYTMGYIEGETLADRIVTDGPLPVGEATRILHDVARAVHCAHEQGIVHRDLKPNNVLLERESGRAYVTDFGLAWVVGEALLPGGAGSRGEDDGRTFGTYQYVSPEQAAGWPADRRSDVYSLGVLGYFMATGQPLFTGTDEEMIAQHIHTPAPPLRVLNRHLDTTLARAVARCLVKNPDERFQTAAELARALSLAPELRAHLPAPQREFVSWLKLESNAAASWGMLLGLAGLVVLGGALDAGRWGTAAGAAGLLGLLLASPVVGALPATRRLLEQRYGRADIVHALQSDLDRQREERRSRWGPVADATATVWRRVLASALGLFGLGTVAALLRAPLPERLVYGSIIVGALGTLGAGLGLVARESRRNELVGNRWLWFWGSPLGKWTVKLAGIGLGPVAAEPQLPEPTETGVPLPAQPRVTMPRVLGDLEAVAGRTRSCIARGRACLTASSATREKEGRAPTPQELEREQSLERQIAVLEAWRARFGEVDAGTVDAGSLTGEIEAAQEVCDAVEALIEGRQGRR